MSLSLQEIFGENLIEYTSKALEEAAELAKEEAIKTNTGIAVWKDGKVVTITADELKQRQKSK